MLDAHPRVGALIACRLPILALLTAFLCLSLALRYRTVNADAAVFGLMGDDLLRHGYLPTLPYGQLYLLSITPYIFALVRWIMPHVLSPVVPFVIAGVLLSGTGLWLLYESLLSAQRSRGRPALLAGLLFCALVAASPGYIFDISENSSIEISLLLMGVVMFAGSRIEEVQREGGATRAGAWFALGAGTAYAYCARPAIVPYGACLALLLLAGAWKRGDRRDWGVALLALATGLLAGCLPMLLHEWLRAPVWPFSYTVHPHVGSGAQVRWSLNVLFTGILPRTFMVGDDAPVYRVVKLFWVAVALAGAGVAMVRRPRSVSALDWTWVAASLLLLAIVALSPQLSASSQNRRYCEHIFLGVAWLFCRFCLPTRGWRRLAPAGLVAALALFAVVLWPRWFERERQQNENVRYAAEVVVPELMRAGGPIFADYWDAYLLAFLSDQQLPIEAFPWQLVRTYGRLSEETVQRKAFWLVRSGYGHATWNVLEADFGADAMSRLQRINLESKLWGRACELWHWDDGAYAVALMKKHHPFYFSTIYPPGSRANAAAVPRVGHG